jgi:hypothetical protein
LEEAVGEVSVETAEKPTLDKGDVIGQPHLFITGCPLIHPVLTLLAESWVLVV